MLLDTMPNTPLKSPDGIRYATINGFDTVETSIGQTQLRINWHKGHLQTIFPDGSVCEAAVEGNDPVQYAQTARELGYGDSIIGQHRLAIENDLGHSWICWRTGQAYCPVLWGTAHNRWWFLWQEEDNVVLALQALMNGIDYESLPFYRKEPLKSYLKWTLPKLKRQQFVEEFKEFLQSVGGGPE